MYKIESVADELHTSIRYYLVYALGLTLHFLTKNIKLTTSVNSIDKREEKKWSIHNNNFECFGGSMSDAVNQAKI